MSDSSHPRRIGPGLLFAVYLLLALFSEYWLGLIWPHPFGEDFLIYYRALQSAQSGQSAYFPYSIGGSFVYHPFALSLVSLFAWPGQAAASILWAIANAIAYGLAIFLTVRMSAAVPSDSALPWGRAWSMGGLFILFAPFLEMLHIGQINGLVVLCLVLCLYLSEQKRPVWSGISLGLAIALKTSPVILLAYFLVVGRWREVIAAGVSLAALTLIAWLQFGSSILADYRVVLFMLGDELHLNFFNHSFPALAVRTADHWGLAADQERVKLAHKVVLATLTVGLLIPALWLPRSNSQEPRRWLFGLLVTLMTVASPLFWYHHNVFLLLPLALLIGQGQRRFAIPGLIVILLIQLERLFEYLENPSGPPVLAGLPVLIAHLGLLSLLVWGYWQALRTSLGGRRQLS